MATISHYGLFVLELCRAFHVPQHEVPVPPALGGGGVRGGEGATIKLWVVVKVGIIAAASSRQIGQQSSQCRCSGARGPGTRQNMKR